MQVPFMDIKPKPLPATEWDIERGQSNAPHVRVADHEPRQGHRGDGDGNYAAIFNTSRAARSTERTLTGTTRKNCLGRWSINCPRQASSRL